MEDKLKNFKPLSELLDSVKDIDGFPIGEDKDILALSDAPYYTACPNPYINDFIEAYGKLYDETTDTYEKKPFVGDVVEGKNDVIYNAHGYHTKVPYKAIVHYIEHYTNKGDIILDGFAGSGMTGIASIVSGRNAILSDISTAASLIEHNYTFSVDVFKLKQEFQKIINEVEKETEWMFTTVHTDGKVGKIDNVLWSDIFQCKYCGEEIFFAKEVIDYNNKTIHSSFKCSGCGVELTKKELKKVFNKKYDSNLKSEINQAIQKPARIFYSVGTKSFSKELEQKDLEKLEKLNNLEIPYWYPINRMPLGDEARRNDIYGLTHIHHFFTKRNLWVLSSYFSKIWQSDFKNQLLFIFQASIQRATLMNRFRFGGTGSLSGTLYVPSLCIERAAIPLIKNKARDIFKMLEFLQGMHSKVCVSTQSTTDLKNVFNNSIDYIFTDPPFGSNLMYSELNFLWEAWLKNVTNIENEAIMNKTQNKGIHEYKSLLLKSFKEYNRILKPNRWITVEFHNSQAAVWNVIQESITKAGFIIAQVAVLDKKQGSFKQVTSAGAVSKDLVINAYKPKTEFKERFLKTAGEGMEVEFVRQQLNHLPIEPNVERTEQMLYSKMLAHYIENGFKIKYNSQNFFELLESNFVELDGYWLDESEVLRYNEWKSKQGNLDKIKELKNTGMILFINNEKTALQWIYQFLNEPKSFSDISVSYNMIVDSKSKDEIPELREMLSSNFFTEEGKYRRPYTKDERNHLKKHREKELEKAWEKILERAKNEGNKMKTVRKEALEYGFKKSYDEENYNDIILVGKKLHDSILEENSDITDFIDIAEIKLDI